MHIFQKSISIVALTALTACAIPDWLGAGESEPKLEGDRFEVMSIGSQLSVDESIKNDNVNIPPAQTEIPFNYGNYSLAGKLENQQSISIGESAEEYFKIINAPIFADGKIFVVDGSNSVSALDTNLQTLWTAQIVSSDDAGQHIPAGIVYKNNRIFVSTGFGKVAALDAGNGKILWERFIGAPMRNAPAVDSADAKSDKVFISTADNKVFALSAETGEVIWRHSGIAEVTRKFATAEPAVKNNIVVTSYSSGEIFGINSAQGREIWSEFLSAGPNQTKVAAGLNDVSATPLIVDGILYATNAGGKFVAINFNNGARIWEKPLAGVATPWAADRFIFVINDDGNMVALNRYDGDVKWIKPLREATEDDDKKHVKWQGPIMANGMLIAHNNFGEMIMVEPNNGNTISRKEIPEGVYTPATVINSKIYFVTNDANLIEIK